MINGRITLSSKPNGVVQSTLLVLFAIATAGLWLCRFMTAGCKNNGGEVSFGLWGVTAACTLAVLALALTELAGNKYALAFLLDRSGALKSHSPRRGGETLRRPPFSN